MATRSPTSARWSTSLLSCAAGRYTRTYSEVHMEKVKVGVLGSGDVGKVLAGGFLKVGHEVRIGSRSPEKLKEWAAGAGDGASTGTFAEAAEFGDMIVLATLGEG